MQLRGLLNGFKKSDTFKESNKQKVKMLEIHKHMMSM